MWLEQLTGIREGAGVDVGLWLRLDGEWLTSLRNGRRMRWGRLDMPSLADLRAAAMSAAMPTMQREGSGQTTVCEVVADVGRLHLDEANQGALFQVASQFNLLEMASPSVTPEDGIERYEGDRTQGPACAVACGAGTIYRNYLVPVSDDASGASSGERGQRADRQLDTIADLGEHLGNDGELWAMQNGYALATSDGLAAIAAVLDSASSAERAELAGLLRIGLQLDTEVTAGRVNTPGHTVDQAFCSALPVAFGDPPPEAWEPFARLVLDASYEATLLAAITRSSPRVFLPLLGGGVFGNDVAWIVDAIGLALANPTIANAGLDVRIVSHGRSNPALTPLLTR
ncbi:MAG: hypothetical protein ACR2QO_25445 [Acidimicrobiales bacterium]